jgi:hypothetical protein
MANKNFTLLNNEGHVHIPGLVSNIASMLEEPPEERGQVNYDKHGNARRVENELQVPGSLARYNIPQYKELHFQIKKTLEELFDVTLQPTYYYDRFYFVGQELKRHRDRPACEISVTLQVSSNRDQPWPICIEACHKENPGCNGNEASLEMEDGDVMVYMGCEREHWRDPLPSRYGKRQRVWRKLRGKDDDTYHHQIFFHYVNSDGPYVHHAFDACDGVSCADWDASNGMKK